MDERTAAEKRAVAHAAAALIEPGTSVGLGSGTTSLMFLGALGQRVAEGLTLGAVVATSAATEAAAVELGLRPVDMAAGNSPKALDIAVDGADEVDPAFRLIKGGGASLLREKIVARMARRFIVIVDESKLVQRLGAFALPVEVQPFGFAATAAAIEGRFGVVPSVRIADGEPLLTDNGNLIFDCAFGAIADPPGVAAQLSELPGVVEHGLFLDEADTVMVGRRGRVETREKGAGI